MAKILLSKLSQAVSEVIGNIYQGVVASRDTGIDWARSPEKVDFQAEIILTPNDLEREQLSEAAESLKVTYEGTLVTTALQGPGRTVSEDTNTSNSIGTRSSTGTNTSSGNTTNNSTGNRTSSGNNTTSSNTTSNSTGNRNSTGNNTTSNNAAGNSNSDSVENSNSNSNTNSGTTNYTYA